MQSSDQDFRCWIARGFGITADQLDAVYHLCTSCGWSFRELIEFAAILDKRLTMWEVLQRLIELDLADITDDHAVLGTITVGWRKGRLVIKAPKDIVRLLHQPKYRRRRVVAALLPYVKEV